MIDDFDTVKKQLSQLAGVINAFKSEAVQLRIIELVLGRSSQMEHTGRTDDDRGAKAKKKPQRRKSRQRQTDGPKQPAKRKVSSGSGAVATLSLLVEGKFFDKPRTINDMIEHCKHKLARTFRANDLSGKLARMVRNEELTREKNADGQYEYKKP